MNKRESSFLNAAKLRTTLYIEEVLQKIAVMNFFSIVIAILALSLTSVVCDTGTEPDNFVPNLNLQKELQDIRNQIYHESTIRLQFDKELSSMARRYRTLIVDQTNAKIENNKTKTTLSKLEHSVQNLQQNTTEKLNKFDTVVTSFVLDFQAIKNAMNDSSKKVNNLEAAFHDLQRNFTASKIKLDAVLQALQETINAMNEQFTELNSSIVENKSAKERYLRGNKYIHELTASRSCSLRIEMTDWNNNVGYAEYSTFRVDSETDGFKLHVGGFSGDKGDFLKSHNGKKFTTKDRDQDTHSSGNCAIMRSGAWWYYACTASNLNGDYSVRSSSRGVRWGSLYLKKTEMMLKCN
ncbi:hypothetical protein FSP39_020647 [Pinctada imbricata]|uniref:Fibrinogen C-terminal domain-containing protein n=1 Tax=Pinctada imbricata TaxID=66713 RepID=A0AA89C771_PINIB|nr:hypothetical protein FSP39_020647 [Pinctada imbricata]